MDTAQIVWVCLMVVFIIAEALTVGLVSIWFAAGSMIALLSSFISAPLWLQIALFFIVSILLLAITRPLAAKYINARTQATNADAIIGREATITERIDNIAGTGMAVVSGRKWTARSANGEPIEAGTLAWVAAIEGVKVMVVPQRNHEAQTQTRV